MSQDEGDDKRKKNFCLEEKEILTAAIVKYDAQLHGSESARTSKARKREIYTKVAAQLNVLGHETRTWGEVQKKVNDMRRRVRDKLLKIKVHARAIGGGKAKKVVHLSEAEEAIASVLHKEQVHGLRGVDSREHAAVKRK